jgi:methyl-accepting chemotaxis protein
MIIDPTQIICDSFKKILDSAFSKFKYYADKIEREYDRISDQIDLLNDQISEPIEEIQNSIHEKNNEINAKLDEMNNLAASVPLLCLDGIFNNIKEFSNNISTGVNNLLSDITPEVDVLGLMTQFTGNLQKYDITSLIESLDVSLGCLNDQNCLPIEEIDYYNNYINNFISKVGLSESGEFD